MNQLVQRVLPKTLMLRKFNIFLQQRLLSMAVSKQYFSIASSKSKYTFDEEQTKPLSIIQTSNQSHKSNAQELINKIPVIEVDQNTIRCRGVNELALGHPVVYIQVMGKYPHIPAKCKWCGLRYIKRGYLQSSQDQEEKS